MATSQVLFLWHFHEHQLNLFLFLLIILYHFYYYSSHKNSRELGAEFPLLDKSHFWRCPRSWTHAHTHTHTHTHTHPLTQTLLFLGALHILCLLHLPYPLPPSILSPGLGNRFWPRGKGVCPSCVLTWPRFPRLPCHCLSLGSNESHIENGEDKLERV